MNHYFPPYTIYHFSSIFISSPFIFILLITSPPYPFPLPFTVLLFYLTTHLPFTSHPLIHLLFLPLSTIHLPLISQSPSPLFSLHPFIVTHHTHNEGMGGGGSGEGKRRERQEGEREGGGRMIRKER